MESDKSMKLMLRLVLAMIVLMPAVLLAQGRYVSRPVVGGTLYFLEPQKLGIVDGAKKFEYDVTYVTSADSATVNFTVIAREAVKPINLRLTIGGDSIVNCTDYELFFIDNHGSNYEIRVSSRYAYADITKALTSTVAPIFSLNLGDTRVTATYKSGAWQKDRKKIAEVINLIELTR